MSMASSSLDLNRTESTVARRNSFALWMAAAMLALNFIGFGPTLYLRPFFDVPPIPLYLYLHGLIGTAWFLLLFVQAWLVTNRRIDTHRQVGWAGVAIALLVLVYGVYTSTNLVPRNVAAGNTSEEEIALFSFVTGADLSSFIVFPTFVSLAVWFRRRADVHRRLMLYASWSILGPALARIASWFASLPNPIAPLVLLCLVIAMFAHDMRTRQRPHVATVLGLLFFIVVNAAMQLSGVGSALVQARLGGQPG